VKPSKNEFFKFKHEKSNKTNKKYALVTPHSSKLTLENHFTNCQYCGSFTVKGLSDEIELGDTETEEVFLAPE
jgi:hypothetical protein